MVSSLTLFISPIQVHGRPLIAKTDEAMTIAQLVMMIAASVKNGNFRIISLQIIQTIVAGIQFSDSVLTQ
jgi:hypothetical protein